ncbi:MULTISPECIES: hypothetical protein [Phnomibacter]|uniref:Uncharacterized protein n=1 Tax=Phnomibacter ginsenosidimutans TaxID=2676868 RepID=A0A6I6G2E0_9BACT|nr:hypothetical protein [Phnomibacter ginsenosidimutans]QGW26766.1 hypothetical protein GLV81_00380 [Phnomibacter ginsenosidimutans]
MVRDKLASYCDPEHTVLNITNYGKFWILRGGYTSFLSDQHVLKEKPPANEKDQQKVELLEARLKLTHYRLVGFWITLVISLVGFLLSVINLYLYFSKK